MKCSRTTDDELNKLMTWLRNNTDIDQGIHNLFTKTVFGYSVLVDNTADKSKDYLEYRPDIKEFLDSKQNENRR